MTANGILTGTKPCVSQTETTHRAQDTKLPGKGCWPGLATAARPLTDDEISGKKSEELLFDMIVITIDHTLPRWAKLPDSFIQTHLPECIRLGVWCYLGYKSAADYVHRRIGLGEEVAKNVVEMATRNCSGPVQSVGLYSRESSRGGFFA